MLMDRARIPLLAPAVEGTLSENLPVNQYAKFWAVDLHTHTPASRDVNESRFGGSTPDDIVEAALSADLDAIAITDHNTTEWCDQMADAARSTDLVILPGVEISTRDGHLLGVWEEGTPASRINEILVRLGIGEEDRGRLDIVADVGFLRAAEEISKSQGLAIAAHVDRPRGLLELPVAGTIKEILNSGLLHAVEVVDLESIQTVRAKLQDPRRIACVQGSDSTLTGSRQHVLAGIGSRRTFIKAARPDLVGIAHALDDYDLRVEIAGSPAPPSHSYIEDVYLSGGFFEETTIFLSPDLNCMLGGTGTGKSLFLEAVRYVLDQQVDASAFPAIFEEVESRLTTTMGSTGTVTVSVVAGDNRYRIKRPVGSSMDGEPTVLQLIGDEWMTVDDSPRDVIKLVAFSQGEALEFSRQPVGRMSLVDGGLDLDHFKSREDQLVYEIEENGERLLAQLDRVAELEAEASEEKQIRDRTNELSRLFEGDKVDQQKHWTTERAAISGALSKLPSADGLKLEVPAPTISHQIEGNADLFETGRHALEELAASIHTHVEAIDNAIQTATADLGKVKEAWTGRFDTFKSELDKELATFGDGASLVALRAELERLQSRLVEIQEVKKSLVSSDRPELEALKQSRETLLDELQKLRKERRTVRRQRVSDLNSKTAGIVKLDIPTDAGTSNFRQALQSLKVGSRVREASLDAMAQNVHPFRFVREFLHRTPSNLVTEGSGFDEADLARLLTNIDDRHLWAELLKIQTIPMPDRLTVKFKKPETGTYEHVEKLAPGQRCTAVLVVLLADGNAPAIVDQPEDALHAPWIEEYIVDRLRELRGGRQYIFATRSPGIVVGADAEQIITMEATSGHGTIEAAGSLERHDLNKLALHHLEGGPEPYRRRRSKLKRSVDPAT